MVLNKEGCTTWMILTSAGQILCIELVTKKDIYGYDIVDSGIHHFFLFKAVISKFIFQHHESNTLVVKHLF